jgi:hypothetical protein
MLTESSATKITASRRQPFFQLDLHVLHRPFPDCVIEEVLLRQLTWVTRFWGGRDEGASIRDCRGEGGPNMFAGPTTFGEIYAGAGSRFVKAERDDSVLF